MWGINRRVLADLVSAGIRNMPYAVDNSVATDWEAVIDASLRHEVAAIIYRTLSKCGERLNIPAELLEKLRSRILYEGMLQERNYPVIRQILGRMADAGIPVIALKGLVLRKLYPYPDMRTMCDFDILVKSRDMPEARRIIEEAGYEMLGDDGKELKYIHKDFASIDLHRLMAPARREFGRMAGLEEKVWECAVPVDVEGARAFSLSPQDNVLFLVIHMASHIFGKGFGLRQMCDLFILMHHYGNQVDWDAFFKKAQMQGVDTFATALMKACGELFGPGLPDGCRARVEDFREDGLLETLTEDIFDARNAGGNSAERAAANRLLYYSGGRDVATFREKVFMYLGLLLPKAERLGGRYRYAKKCRFLLPVAWLHRIIFCIARRDIDFAEKTAVLISAKPAGICERRKKLLRGLGLLDGTDRRHNL